MKTKQLPLFTRGRSTAKTSKRPDSQVIREWIRNSGRPIGNRGIEIENVILYLSPGGDLCPSATAGCLRGCLQTAGRMQMSNAVAARRRRTRMYRNDRSNFVSQLRDEIRLLVARANRRRALPVVRLNGTSDISWHADHVGLFDMFPDVVFYDYTKRADHVADYVNGKMPPNYHVTFSWAETGLNQGMAITALRAGMNVAVVFASADFPETFRGFDVIDGDAHDMRFLDGVGPDGCGLVVGLKAKGRARKDVTGFVQHAGISFVV